MSPHKRPKLTREFIEGFISDGCPGPHPAEQAVKAVRFIGDAVSKSGTHINIPDDLFVIIGSPSPRLAADIIIGLQKRGVLDGKVVRSMGPAPAFLGFNLTLDGWDQYEAERRGHTAGSYGFLAMKFDDEDLERFAAEVIKPAVKNGIAYDLVDVRDVSRAGVIDNIMRAQIRDSAFVIVDLTHDNYGAYWEAGYAEGLGKQVIYICERRKFQAAQTHFDTNHCTTVLWSDGDIDAIQRFTHELVATLRRSLNLFP
jgi:nucleoside 2-deoxyribosyltransferase